MFLFFLVLIQIASSGSTSATTTTKIVIGHSTEGGGSTFSHFRVSLPNIHGSKQGAAKDRIYNEDSIKSDRPWVQEVLHSPYKVCNGWYNLSCSEFLCKELSQIL